MTDDATVCPDLPHLRALLADAWVDSEIFGDHPKHELGRWQKSQPSNPWVPYVEGLVQFLLTHDRVKFVRKDLKRKFKAEYASTLAEMEVAVFLAQRGFLVTLEPSAPKKGPDVLAEWEGVPYFIEIREVGFSWEEERIQSLSKEFFTTLNGVPSRYSVALTIGEGYTARSTKLKAALVVVLDALELVKESKPANATLYYAHPDGTLLNSGVDLADSRGIVLSERAKRYEDIVKRADFIARFKDLGQEQAGTPATVSRKLKLPPDPVNTHERLKSILIDKCRQLPKGERGILVLEVSEQFMLSEFTILSALYGDLEVSFPPVDSPGEPVGEMRSGRNERSFFGLTARVSAVVIHKRILDKGTLRGSWDVYATNRANADTIRLSLCELECSGEVRDRKNLAAEECPYRLLWFYSNESAVSDS